MGGNVMGIDPTKTREKITGRYRRRKLGKGNTEFLRQDTPAQPVGLRSFLLKKLALLAPDGSDEKSKEDK